MGATASKPNSKSNKKSNEDPKLGFQVAPSWRSAADQDPLPKNLNHVEAENDPLHVELQYKLVLKDEDEKGETEKKDSNFDDGNEGISEGGREESGKGEDNDVDNRNWKDKENDNWKVDENDGWKLNDNENDGWKLNENEIDGWELNEDENDGRKVNEIDGWELNENEIDYWKENVIKSGNEKVGGYIDGVIGDAVAKKDERSSGRTYQYPVRPEAGDCAFYLKTGTCKFGSNCKFKHPVRRKNQLKAVKEKKREKDESTETPGQAECKYDRQSGGRKHGKSCRYNHTRGKSSATPILELNFMGLPIRLGKKECPYYMRTGSCKYGENCKFNHPDPTAVEGCDPPTGYANGASVSLQGVSQSSLVSLSPPRTLNETAPFVPMILSPPQGVSPQCSEWNGYQPPVYLPERTMHPPSYVMDNPANETNVYMHQPQQMQVEEFPEQLGEPECNFLKTGNRKFKSNCKFHRPKSRISRPPPCTE
ncbi:Zinc finger CCCH domain-containing protein [Quillaja saponaria]|uniref:Zinc finger CCCH domain-containing protein n=1 Tax=Quillaja saponaria TaxID=32244 RepID=A0AAD7PIM1_QUISA|nr:Zinc finger CCCH domain-containing protein [Quillaja saponaria]